MNDKERNAKKTGIALMLCSLESRHNHSDRDTSVFRSIAAQLMSKLGLGLQNFDSFEETSNTITNFLSYSVEECKNDETLDYIYCKLEHVISAR